MNIKQKSFAQAFKKVAGLATGRTTLPIISCVKLEAKDGRLIFSTTDLDAHAESSCECDGILEPICVSAQSVNILCQQAPETIVLERVEKRLRFTSGGVAMLPTMDAAEFPAFPNSGKSIGLACEELANAIAAVKWCTRDDDVPLMGCIGVETASKFIRASASNRRGMACCDIPTIAAACSFTLPHKASDVFVEGLRSPGCDFSLASSFAIASSDSFKVAVKLFDMTYFDLQKILTVGVTPVGEIDREELESVMGTIASLSAATMSAEFEACTLAFDGDGLTISYAGQSEFSRTIEGKFEPWTARFDPKRLNETLRAHSAPSLKVSKAKAGCDAIMFSAGDFTAVLGSIVGKESK